MHLDHPITHAIQNHPYSFNLPEYSKAYFVYTHEEESSFDVYQLLTTGEANIEIIPLDSSTRLDELLSAHPGSFSLNGITGDHSQSGIHVSVLDRHFCHDCSYLIAVSSKLAAKGELFISSVRNPVPLSINSLLNEKIFVNEEKTRVYRFNSHNNFNLTLNMIYGKVKV